MVNLTGTLPPALGGEQETPPSYEPEMDLNKTQQFAGTIKGELGLSEDLMEEVEDYLKNPPPKPKQSPIDAAIDAGYLIAKKISKDKTKYMSGLAEYTPEGNKAIRGMFTNALGADPDWNPTDVAWCATFVSQVLSELGADPLRSKDRYDRVRADKYRNYGSPVEINNITEGDIVVLDFDGDGRGDHATFYVGDKDDINNNPDSPYISVLGGNQGDAVNIRQYDKENILAVRRITYDDIDYEFTKELARDNADFNAFLQKEGEGFNMKSLEENPMSPSNRPMTSRPEGFDEGGLAENDNLDLARSYGVTVVDPEETVQAAKDVGQFALESLPGVGTAFTAAEIEDELKKEDPNYLKIGMLVGSEAIGLIPGLGTAAKNMIRKGADMARQTDEAIGVASNIPKVSRSTTPSYTDTELLEADEIISEWGKGNLTNTELRNQMRDKGFKIETKRISPKMAGDELEVVGPDGNIVRWKDMPRGTGYEKEMISVFPKPERMFPEDARPKGGDYLNPATGEVISGRNVSAATLKISPDGKPSFKVSNDDVEEVGSVGKGKTQIKTNLFKKKAGWKWTNAPEGMEDIATLISVENKGKHYYTIETDFSKGVNLKKYPNSKTEPRLRPTVIGELEIGDQIGTISVRGKEHPVYSKVRTFNQGGPVMNEQMEMAFMQEGGIKDDGMKVDPVSGNEIPPGSMANEVRDDIPAMLSEGEYVVPADVLRYYGVNFFENLRGQAKQGLQSMEADGRIGGEPLTPEQAQQNMSGQPMAGAPAIQPIAANSGVLTQGQQQQQANNTVQQVTSMPGVATASQQNNQAAVNTFNPFSFSTVGFSQFGPQGTAQTQSITTTKTFVNAENPSDKRVIEYVNGQIKDPNMVQYTQPPYYEQGSAGLTEAIKAFESQQQQPTDGGGDTDPPEPTVKDPNEWAKEITDPNAWADEALTGKATTLISTIKLATNVARVNAMAEVAKAQGNTDLYNSLKGKADEFVKNNPVLNSLPNAWIDGDKIAADLEKDKDMIKNLFGMKTEEQKQFGLKAEQEKRKQRAQAAAQAKADREAEAAALKAAQASQDDDDDMPVTNVQIDRDPMGQATMSTTYGSGEDATTFSATADEVDPSDPLGYTADVYRGGLMARKKSKKKK